MVCWPLRSSQNFGTGTAVASLGGLGRYDAVLINGPTWGANYMDFTSIDRWVRVSPNVVLMPATPNCSVLVVGYGHPGRYGSGFGSGPGAREFGVNHDGPSAIRVTNDTTVVSHLSAIWSTTVLAVTQFAITGEQTGRAFRNATAVTVTGGGTNYTSIAGGSLTNVFGVGTTGSGTPDLHCSFVAFFNTNTACSADLYRLYALTLGQGLSL